MPMVDVERVASAGAPRSNWTTSVPCKILCGHNQSCAVCVVNVLGGVGQVTESSVVLSVMPFVMSRNAWR